jgi:SNF2 family DNA or RNA helicase
LENLLSFVWPGHGRRAVTRAVAGGDLAQASQALRPLFTRTTKSELGLPPVTTKVRYLALPLLHREIYDALVGRYSARAEESRADLDALGKAMLRLLMAAACPTLLAESASAYEPLDYRVPALAVPESDSLFQLLKDLPGYELSPKYQEALAIAAENAKRGRKTLVWTGFVRGIKTLEILFAQFKPAVVHGGTADREEQLLRFRDDPDCMVLISNPATLGEGISLHRECHDAVYIDRDFQAGRFLQSLDRIHRLGLAPGVETTVTVLMSEGTIDEIVGHRLEEKLLFMGRILDDPAVQQLGDLAEEPALSGGMDARDAAALLGHLAAR